MASSLKILFIMEPMMSAKSVMAVLAVTVALSPSAFSTESGVLPSFSVEPQSAVVRAGSTLTLSCSAQPNSATIRWTINGSTLASQKSRGIDVRDGTVRIQSFNQPESVFHEGIYHCVATTQAGSVVSREAKLEMAAMRPFQGVRSVVSWNALEGNVAVIPCTAPQSQPTPVIEFEFNGTKIPFSGHHVILPSGFLQIPNVSRMDEGLYQCTAYNPVIGTRIRSPISHRLSVLASAGNEAAPKWTWTSPDTVTATQGRDLTLECAAEGIPSPQVTWEKYGGQLPVGRFTQVLGNLVIVSVQKFDSGTYLCRANNGIEPAPTKVISVEVLEIPTIELGPVNQMSQEGTSVTFKCRTQGSPKVTVQWLFNGIPLVNGPTVAVRDTSLTLSSIQRRQSGMYQCIARNVLGAAYASARLIVTESAARGSSGANGRAPSMSPSHEPVDFNTDYDEDEEEEDDLNPEGRRTPGKTRTGEAEVDDGKERKVEDRAELPSPSRPEVTRLSDSSVLVQWAMPSVPAGSPTVSPTVSMFKIQYKGILDDQKSSWLVMDDNISYALRMFEVPNLRPETKYRVRVIAVYSNNDIRLSPSSAKFSLQASVAAPVVVEARPLSTSEIFIGWQQQESENWQIDGFSIFYSPFGEDYRTQKLVVPGARVRHAVLSHLQSGTAYSIRMKSYNVASLESNFSNTVVKNTLTYLNEPLPKDGDFSAIRPMVYNPKHNTPLREEGEIMTRRFSPVEDFSSAEGIRQNSKEELSLVVIVIAAAVIFVAIFALCAFVFIWKRRQKQALSSGINKDSTQSPVLLQNLTLGAKSASDVETRASKYMYKVPTTHVPGCSGQCHSTGILNSDDCPSKCSNKPASVQYQQQQASVGFVSSSSVNHSNIQSSNNSSCSSNCSSHESRMGHDSENRTAGSQRKKNDAGSRSSRWFPTRLSVTENISPDHIPRLNEHRPLFKASDEQRKRKGNDLTLEIDNSPLEAKTHNRHASLSELTANRLQPHQQLGTKARPPGERTANYSAFTETQEPIYRTIDPGKKSKLKMPFAVRHSSDFLSSCSGDSLNSVSAELSTLRDSYDSLTESPELLPPVPVSFSARYSQRNKELTTERPASNGKETQLVPANCSDYANVLELQNSWNLLANQISDGSYNVRPCQTNVEENAFPRHKISDHSSTVLDIKR